MNATRYNLSPTTSLFVKDVLVFEKTIDTGNTILPFFADGYPGLIFQITPQGQWVQPQNKQMPTTYLYGQTLHPIELHMQGAYMVIGIQLYPFVLNSFFGLNSTDLNNACYDLNNLFGWQQIEVKLMNATDTAEQVDILMGFLEGMFQAKKEQLDFSVKDAIQMILDSKAQITVAGVATNLHITARTLERRFLKETGISAKQFIQITRFQQSMEQMAGGGYTNLTDVVYNNGYADQSHFIRVFKAFTGTTPGRFGK